ncbi:hypothetical protein [Mycolicibacterium tusciae]|uniref:hypothetical protein n=1 Tax=Mycolicibacterium tusciae TaxID=75922 RepID=UPI00024A1B23|nr:hypothetical protein [Mycolicibacterium tusciae]
MSEINGDWEARAETTTFDSVEHAPLETENPEQTGEFHHQVDGAGRPELDREIGHAALDGYEDVPAEPHNDGEFTDAWDRSNETEGTIEIRGDVGREIAESGDAEEVYDIWDRRNETSGSINLRNFGL